MKNQSRVFLLCGNSLPLNQSASVPWSVQVNTARLEQSTRRDYLAPGLPRSSRLLHVVHPVEWQRPTTSVITLAITLNSSHQLPTTPTQYSQMRPDAKLPQRKSASTTFPRSVSRLVLQYVDSARQRSSIPVNHQRQIGRTPI